MEKTLLFYNETEATKAIALLQQSGKSLQNVVTEFCSYGEDITLTNEQLIPCLERIHTRAEFDMNRGYLVGDPYKIKSLLIEKAFPGGKLNGVEINIDEAERILNIHSLDSLLSMIRQCSIPTLDYLTQGVLIIKDNRVEIAEAAIQRIEESFKFYIENEIEQLRFNSATKLANALNELCELLPGPIDEIGDLEMILEPSAEGLFVPNPEFVKFGRAGQYWKFSYELGLNKPKPATPRGEKLEDGNIVKEFLASVEADVPPKVNYNLNEFYNISDGD